MVTISQGARLPAVLVILTLSPAGLSQSPKRFSFVPVRHANELFLSSPQEVSEPPLRIDVDMVLVPVMVTDMMNRPVTGLEQERFSLYQDGAQQEIKYFSTQDGPISIGLVLDLSGSMTEKFEVERAAVTEFFKNANAQDDYFVVTFSDHPTLVARDTESIDTIQQNLARQTPGGGTALFDATYLAMAQMRSAQYRRRALLVISDGGDNSSVHSLKQTKKLVRDSDVWVYAIGIFDAGPFKTLEEVFGRQWLSEITGATGGRTMAVNLPRVAEAAATISREIRNQYVLGYDPTSTSHGRRPRKIKIRVKVATPEGYSYDYYKTGYVTSEGPTLSLYNK